MIVVPSASACVDITVLDIDARAQRLQALNVLVHRPRADRATAGQRHQRLAEPRQQRSQHQNGGAHGLHHLVRRDAVMQIGGEQVDTERFLARHLHTHPAQERERRADVAQVWNVAHPQRAGGEERGAKDRQRGVLRTRHAHLAGQGHAALDQEFVHAGAIRAGPAERPSPRG